MKTLPILIFSFLTTLAVGQDIRQQNKTMSLGPQNAFYVEFDGVDKKIVEDTWEDYLKESFKKVKFNRKAKEYFTESGTVSLISGSRNITIYSKIEEGRDQTTLYAWVDMGDGFLSGDGREAGNFTNYLSDYWVMAKKKGVEAEIKEEEKRMKGLEKDLSKLEKKNTDLHQDIEDYQNRIRKAESDIEQNLKEQDDKRVEIESQKSILERLIEKLNAIGKK